MNCGLCQQLHQTKPFVAWCPECNEFLCESCNNFHELSKLSNTHEVISVENYLQIPDELLVAKNVCGEHNLKHEFYCKNHESACCSLCMKNEHAECPGNEFGQLSNVVKGIKTSVKFSNIESGLIDISKDLRKLIAFTGESIESLDEQAKSCLNDVREIRKKINSHFDRLEKDLIEKIEMKKKELQEQANKLLNELQSKQSSIAALQENQEKLETFSTNYHTFFGLNEIERKLNDQQKYIKSLLVEKSIAKQNIQMDFSSLSSMFNTTKIIGELVVEKTVFSDSLNVLKSEHAQFFVSKPKSIHDFKFKLKNKVNLRSKIEGSLDGCVIKPSGELLLVGYNSRQLYTCKGDGSNFMSIATFDEKPIDLDFDPVTNTVVVGCVGAEASYVVNLSNNKVNTRDIGCYGVSIYKDKVYGTDPYESKIICSPLNKPDKVYSELTDLDEIYYLSITDNGIFCSCYNENEVLSYNHKGQQQWSFNHEKLKYPLGISSSPDGFSFVACNISNNIWLISPDGTESRIIADQSDGAEKPRGIHFNGDRKELVFANEFSTELFVYDVQW